MSSILPNAPRNNNYVGDVRKYRPRIRVLVHSHRTDGPDEGFIDLSDSVISCKLSKNVKGTGQANLSITADRNYLNFLFADDYINIYFDIEDGSGWTRVFFGLIDKVEENYSTDKTGRPGTSFRVICSDFTKVFDKTQIYFNPHVVRRPDFDGQFLGTTNIGGVALMTSGVRMFGSPDEMVLNIIQILLGFGAQFIVPSSYPKSERTRRAFRRARQEAALRLLQNRITPDEYVALRSQIESEVSRAAASASQQDLSTEEQVGNVLNTLDIQEVDNDTQNTLRRAFDEDNESLRNRILTDLRFQQELNLSQEGLAFTFRSLIERARLSANINSFLDYLDLFTFVEREAIDGYFGGSEVWDRQGNIMSIMTEFSNEIVNELFFDLRPSSVFDDEGNITSGTEYAREPDDILGNLGEHSSTGIKYTPAVIMREYPFSTIPELDARNVPISIAGEDVETGANRIGVVHMGGAIFSDRPNVPGRHLVRTKNINVLDNFSATEDLPSATRILDVAVISNEEIIHSQLGRGDVEHYNLFQITSDGILGQDAMFFMQDILPIITPVHVMQHGLRVRMLRTRFARLSLASSRIEETAPEDETPQAPETNTQPAEAAGTAESVSPVDEEEATEARADEITSSSDTASEDAESVSDVTGGTGNVAEEPTTEITNTTERLEVSSDIFWPVIGNRTNRDVDTTPNRWIIHRLGNYGYRDRPNDGTMYTPNPPYTEVESGGEVPSRRWVFHNGWDVQALKGDEVLSIAEGTVVAVIPAGVGGVRGYGNVVIVKHEPGVLSPDINQPLYSFYAHLDSVDSNLMQVSPNDFRSVTLVEDENGSSSYRRNTSINFTSTDFYRNGQYNPVPVRAGQRLGAVGKTKGADARGNVTLLSTAPHLHFEILTRAVIPTKNDRQTPKMHSNAPKSFISTKDNSNTLDPERFLKDAPIRSTGTTPRIIGGGHPVLANDQYSVTSSTATGGSGEPEFDPDEELEILEDLSVAENFGIVPETQEVTNEETGESETVVNENVEGGTVPTTEEQTAPARARPRSAIDSVSVRRQLARWGLLHDHWFQHNLEYLAGTISMRPAPEIRVGYRLDVLERDMSFYVEGVTHDWHFPNKMVTHLSVTRGQSNNPFPLYVHPASEGFDPTEEQRKLSSRLGKYFLVPESVTTNSSLVLRGGHILEGGDDPLSTVDDFDEVRTVERVTKAANFEDIDLNIPVDELEAAARENDDLSAYETVPGEIAGSSIGVDNVTPTGSDILRNV